MSSFLRMREIPLRPMEAASCWSSAMRMVDSEAGALEVSVTSVLLVWVLPVPAGWRSARQVWDVPGADHGEESRTAGSWGHRPSARWLVL